MSGTPSGTLRVSVPYTWMELKIAPHLGEFMAQYPDIKLDIQCNDNRQDMVADQLDIVIRVGQAVDSSYIAIPLAEIEMKLLASKVYVESHPSINTPSDLHNHRFVTYTGFDTLNYQCCDVQDDIRVNSAMVTNSVDSIIQATKQGIGISLLPTPLIQTSINNGELVHLLPEAVFQLKGLPVKQAFAMYPSRKQMPAKVRVFLNFLKERF